MKTGSRRAKRPEAVRNDLLDTAGRILSTNGIQAFTLDLVAREAGVSKGGLLHHFPSKKALLDGLFSREMELFAQEIRHSMQNDPAAQGRAVRAYVGIGRNLAAKPPSIIRHLLAAMLIDPQLCQEWTPRYWDAVRSVGLFENITPAGLLACLAADGLSLWDMLEADILDGKNREELYGLMERLTHAEDEKH